jgi:hypothetical protein
LQASGKNAERNCRFDSNFFQIHLTKSQQPSRSNADYPPTHVHTWTLAQNIQISWEIADQSSTEMIDLHEKVCRKNLMCSTAIFSSLPGIDEEKKQILRINCDFYLQANAGQKYLAILVFKFLSGLVHI